MAVKPLVRVLTGAGLGPRRRVTEIIKQGRVTVNGTIAESYTLPVDTDKDTIRIDGRAIGAGPEKTVCLMMNKPAGVISTVRDERGRQTVIDVLPPEYQDSRLHPVGRLDVDTTGLLLLTNDGALTYRLTHPAFEHEKGYIVRTGERLTRSEMDNLKNGVRLEDGKTAPARIKLLPSRPPFNYSLVIHEGRKRQVRRMFGKVGHPVLELKRVSFGGLEMGDLTEGTVRKLSQADIRRLLSR